MLKVRKVAVALSGGVDSAVTLLLLKNKGYDVHAVFMQNWDIADETGFCKLNEDYCDAVDICRKLNVPLHRVDFVKRYWNEVFSNLLSDYQNGYTPNPDVLCNRHIKFNYLFKYARECLNADAVATGHYAKTTFGSYLEHYEPNKGVRLLIPKDIRKDQTLFLCQIQQEPLRRTMFPLGDYIKSQVKKIAYENGLQFIAQKKESMGICFIGSRNFQEFISEYIDDKPGSFIDIDSSKVVGEHKGFHYWTLGQRAKLAGFSSPYFLAKKDVRTNDIYVALGADHLALYSNLFYTEKPHWIHCCPLELESGDVWECDFKFQHVDQIISCKVYETTKGLVVSLNNTRRSLTPGQYAVFYKDNECVGSARIMQSGPSLFILNWLKNCNNASNELNCKNEINNVN